MGSDFDLFERLVSNFSAESNDFDIIISTSWSVSSSSICRGTRYPFSDPDEFPTEVSSAFKESTGDLLSLESGLDSFLMVEPLNFLSRIRTLRSFSVMTTPTGAGEKILPLDLENILSIYHEYLLHLKTSKFAKVLWMAGVD